MTDAEKAAMEWLDRLGASSIERDDCANYARTLKAMLAEPRLPKEPSEDALRAMQDGVCEGASLNSATRAYRALHAHLARPHVDFAALDEARMEPEPCVDAEKTEALAMLHRWAERSDWDKERARIARTVLAMLDAPRREENPDLRAAISVLRGWSAEAAGRTGLQPAVRMVCNAAESTLPKTRVRIRGKGLDFIHEGPISLSEVPE